MLYFDDFESRLFSYIGTLTDPGVNDPQATNPAGWTASTYQYSATIPHAVTSVAIENGGTNSYEYDLNGNMTCRVENGVSFKQDYNAENRISAIHKMNGDCTTGIATESWLYAYDGMGTRVTTAHYTGVTLDSMTLYYMGGMYEVTGSAVKKYYSIAGQTVAMNDGSGLKYLLTDHLGSTSAVLDSNGSLLSQQRYLPFGEVRSDVGSITQTDFGYTFQRNLTGTGLMDYRARFYSSALGRFVQPDSIIPNPANPQSFNRFSYVYNRPINFSDPSGHDPYWCEGNDLCMYNWLEDHTTAGGDAYFEEYGVTVDPAMPEKAKRKVMEAIYMAGNRFSDVVGGTSAEAFREVYGLNDGDSFRFEFVQRTCEINGATCWGYTPSSNHIQIYETYHGVWNGNPYIASTPFSTGLILHELGHAFNQRLGGAPMAGLAGDLLARPSKDHGFFAGHYVGQYSHDTSQSEIFADMFVGWTIGMWGDNRRGNDRMRYMNDMNTWVLSASQLP